MSLGGQVTRDPVLVRHHDGHLEVFVVGLDGFLWRKHQSAPSSAFVPEWTQMDGELTVFLYHEPVRFDGAAPTPSFLIDGAGVTSIVAMSSSGRLAYTYAVPGGWSDWKSISATRDNHPAVASPVGVSATPLAGAAVVSRNAAGNCLWKSRGPGIEDWGDGNNWNNLGGVCNPLAVSTSFDSSTRTIRTSIFTRGANNDLWWTGESVTRDGNLTHGRPFSSGWVPARVDRWSGARLVGNPVTTSPGDVMWRGTDGRLWSARVDVDGQFSGISAHTDTGASEATLLAGDPVLVEGMGASWVLWRGGDDNIYLKSIHPGRGWSAVTMISAAAGIAAAGAPSAALSADGRAEVVFRGADGQVYHLWETAVASNTFNEGP